MGQGKLNTFYIAHNGKINIPYYTQWKINKELVSQQCHTQTAFYSMH